MIDTGNVGRQNNFDTRGINMKRVIINGIVLTLILGLSNTVAADDHRQAFKIPGGIETFACQFKEGRDLDDLLVASSHWRLWAKTNFDVDYNAWVLTPRFFWALHARY